MEVKMRKGISDEMVKQSYTFADKYFNGLILRQEAIDTLHNKYGMDRGSAGDYINIYCAMRNGIQYKRTMNKNATEYFLQEILNYYGKAELCEALQAVKLHLKYYESLGHGNLPSIRDVIAKYTRLV